MRIISMHPPVKFEIFSKIEIDFFFVRKRLVSSKFLWKFISKSFLTRIVKDFEVILNLRCFIKDTGYLVY